MSKKARKDRKRIRRQQVRVAKRKALRAAARYKIPGVRGKRALAGLKDFTETQQIWWVTQGINYLASDYSSGLWEPLFPELYEGQNFTGEDIAQRVLARYGDVLEEDPTSVGSAIIAWSVQNRAVVYLYYKQALEAVRKADPEANAGESVRSPHNSAVWQLFETLKGAILTEKQG